MEDKHKGLMTIREYSSESSSRDDKQQLVHYHNITEHSDIYPQINRKFSVRYYVVIRLSYHVRQYLVIRVSRYVRYGLDIRV